jgi:tetratricopeptide (TPR) repeat protein
MASGWKGDRLERLIYLGTASVSAEAERPDGKHPYLNYDLAFAKAEAAVEALLSEALPPPAPTDDLLRVIESLPEAERISLVIKDPRFAYSQVVSRLAERSNALRFSDSRQMLEDARLAVELAGVCRAEVCGSSERLADLKALANSQFATALRVNGQLVEAEAAGNLALALLHQGTGDPVLRAGVFRQIATIYQFQRRFEKAIEILQEAATISRQIGDNHATATALVQESIATLYAGEAEVAVRLLNQAVPLIDQEVDPQLLLAACHNLVRCYIDLDRPEQALAIYSEIRELYKELSQPLISLRAAWQEGQLLRDLGHPQAAETALLRAREGFLERGLMFEVALVSLDLASVYIRMGRAADVRQTAEATVPIFRALKIEREELAALLQLQQVADQQQKALDLVRFLNSRIQPMSRDEVLK